MAIAKWQMDGAEVEKGFSPDNHLWVRATAFTRKFAFSSWSKLRLALRVTAYPRSETVQYPPCPQFAIGLCSSTGAGYLPAGTTGHFLGWAGNKSRASQTGGTTSTSFPVQNLYKHGTTESTGSDASFESAFAMTSNSRSAVILDFTKGSPNWTLGFFGRNNSTDDIDLDDAAWSALLTAEPPVAGRHVYDTRTFAEPDEGTYGTLDRFNVYWDSFYFSLKIHDMNVVKLA